MQNSFYASGFLYHSPSGQILLQQTTKGTDVNLVLFCAKSKKGKDPQAVFQQCIKQTLGVKVDLSAIVPVYDYIHDRLGLHFIFFVQADDITPATFASKNNTEWFPLAKLAKYTMSEQTRHDIIIGERVIRSIAAVAQTH